jgi:hypothetical protein
MAKHKPRTGRSAPTGNASLTSSQAIVARYEIDDT